MPVAVPTQQTPTIMMYKALNWHDSYQDITTGGLELRNSWMITQEAAQMVDHVNAEQLDGEGAKMNTASQVNEKESRINVKLLWRQETMIRWAGRYKK